MTDGGTTGSAVLKKRLKRVTKVLRQIDVIREKERNGAVLDKDQIAKASREDELKAQAVLLQNISKLPGLEQQEKHLAKENKKLNKKLRQIENILKKSDLNDQQQWKVDQKPLYELQQTFYSTVLTALRAEAGGGPPVPLTAQPKSAPPKSAEPEPVVEAEPAKTAEEAPQKAEEAAEEPAATVEETGLAEAPVDKEQEPAPAQADGEVKSPERAGAPEDEPASPPAPERRPPPTPTDSSDEEDQSGSAPNDDEDEDAGSEDSGSAPSTGGEEQAAEASPQPAQKAASVEYQSVMRAVHTRPQEPQTDSDGSESQDEPQQEPEARAPQEPEIAKPVVVTPIMKPVEPEEDVNLGTEYVLVSPVKAEMPTENVEALREQARKNIANTKIAALKKDFWLEFQQSQMEPIEPWYNTPTVVQRIFQFLHVQDAHRAARINKTFANALNSPESYDTLTAVPAFNFLHFFERYPARYTKLRAIHCLRCLHQQLNDQRFWTKEVNEASARVIKAFAKTCKELESIIFGYLSCPEMYQLLCANSTTLKKLQIYESKVLQPQGRIPDSLDLPDLEEMILVNSGFDYWQAVSNLRYLSFSSHTSIEVKSPTKIARTLSDIGRFCRQLEAFEVVYPPQSLSDQIIEEVVHWNENSLRALHITCQPRLMTVPTSHRQLSTALLGRIFACRKLEILVIDGRLTDHNIWMLVDALPRLRILEFSGAGVTENGVKMIVQHCGNLQLLSLTGCEPNAVQRIRESGETPANLQVTAYPIVSPQPGSLRRYLDMRNVPNLTGAVSTVPVKTSIPSGAPEPPQPVVQRAVGLAVVNVPEAPPAAQYPVASPPATASSGVKNGVKPPGIPIPHGISAEPTDYEMGNGITYSTPPAQDAPW